MFTTYVSKEQLRVYTKRLQESKFIDNIALSSLSSSWCVQRTYTINWKHQKLFSYHSSIQFDVRSSHFPTRSVPYTSNIAFLRFVIIAIIIIIYAVQTIRSMWACSQTRHISIGTVNDIGGLTKDCGGASNCAKPNTFMCIKFAQSGVGWICNLMEI